MLEQATMSHNPRLGGVGQPVAGNLYRGRVMKNGVRYTDTSDAKQILVDLYMYDLMPPLYGVPLLSQKINKTNGESEDPEAGDLVAVGFFAGNLRDPVVVGFLPPAENEIQSAAADAPRYHRRRNGTDLKVEKDGTRREYVAKDRITEVAEDDELTVVGNGTVTIGGNLTVIIQGDASVTVQGALTADVTGNTTVTTPLATVNGDVQVNGNIQASGNITAGGNVADAGGAKTMAGMRSTYNSHTHPENGQGGGTTSAPNQSQ